jgi:GT2 family glycosyltransferase
VHAVVVHHRGRDLLGSCLESLLSSRGVDLRVAVVANACTEALPPVAERDPRVAVLRPDQPLGFSAANNRGAAARGDCEGSFDYLFFVNNDTVTHPDALAALARHLEGHPRCGIVGPRLMIQGAGGHLNSLGLNVTRTAEAWDEGIGRATADHEPLTGHRPVLAVTGSALLVRASVFDALGGWEEIYSFYYEDIDLCLRAREAGFDVDVVPEAVVHHVLSATAGLDSEFKLFHTWRNRMLLLAIHWPLGALVAALPRLLLTDTWRLGLRLVRGSWREARIQTRAWLSFWQLLPRALGRRRRHGGQRGWVGLLRPAGSVPRIQLPPAAGAGEKAAATNVGAPP